MELKDKLFHGIKAYKCTTHQERLNLIRLKLERVIITGNEYRENLEYRNKIKELLHK